MTTEINSYISSVTSSNQILQRLLPCASVRYYPLLAISTEAMKTDTAKKGNSLTIIRHPSAVKVRLFW